MIKYEKYYRIIFVKFFFFTQNTLDNLFLC